jgi:hypothetical protein
MSFLNEEGLRRLWGRITTKLDTKVNIDDLPELIKQPDFAASEGEAGHIKNRTHWVDYIENGGEATSYYVNDLGICTINGVYADVELYAGHIYKITIAHGEPYICEAKPVENSIGASSYCGNKALHFSNADDTGEPFYFSWNALDQMSTMKVPQYANTTIDIAVTELIPVVHQLDPKFIKDMYYVKSVAAGDLIVPECELVNDDGMFTLPSLPSELPRLGETYFITYNGVQYECTAQQRQLEDIPVTVLGNYILFGSENTGEPFCILTGAVFAAAIGVSFVLLPIDSTQSVTLSIAKAKENIKHINPKYIKDMYYTEGEEKLLFEVDPLINNNISTDPCYYLPYTNAIDLGEATQLAVTWDGVVYNCSITALSEDGISLATVGNMALMDASALDTGEPFLVGLFLGEAGAALGFGGIVQWAADGNQQHSISVSTIAGGKIHKIDNKYINTEWMATSTVVKGTVLFENQTFPLTDGMFEAEVGTDFITAELGKKYLIVYNGEEYIDTCRDATPLGYPGGIFVGNDQFAIGTGDNGMPFVLGAANGYLMIASIYNLAATSCTISMYEVEEVPNKLPAKFLPDDISGNIDLTGYAKTEDIPTKTSELTNDSGFITAADIPEVEVPTKTSELTNDSGFITAAAIPDSYTKTEVDSAISTAANTVKNDLLNGAGEAYDTLKELGTLIDENQDAIEALETVAAGKADKTHSHAISDVSGLQTALDGKAASSHGTHVSYSTTAPVMDGTASVGSASTVARSDHKHPTDTSRASKTEFDTHTSNTTVHVTSTERTNWNAAKTHADSTHAPSNAEKNQNAFSNIAVSGQTTVAADTATDTVTFAGSNVTITTDATNDKVTFSVADGTTSAKGVVQLTNSTSSTSTTTAATPNSVKSAYDLANGKMSATNPVGTGSFSMNRKTGTTVGTNSVALGNSCTASGAGSHAEGYNTAASGNYTHAECYSTTASGSYSHAEGQETTASNKYSHAEGGGTTASGEGSHAEGYLTTASGKHSHAEGTQTTASGHASHAEGYNTTASGLYAHAEGLSQNQLPDTITTTTSNADIISTWNTTKFTLSKEQASHAEGQSTLALGSMSSHAEGCETIASGDIGSHAEGFHTTASGSASHAEGHNTTASGLYSHAEGRNTAASNTGSHAEGSNTSAQGRSQHAQGEYNITETNVRTDVRGVYAHIVGNGTAEDARSNAHTLDWDGNAWFAGDVYVGSTSGTNKDAGSVKLASETYVATAVDTAIAGITAITTAEIDAICGASIYAASEVTF